MHKNLMRFQSLLMAFVATALLVHAGAVKAADDRAALSGLSEGKIAFDLKDGEGRALLARLDVIDETRLSLIQQGVTPHFILAFRGPATRLAHDAGQAFRPERVVPSAARLGNAVGVKQDHVVSL